MPGKIIPDTPATPDVAAPPPANMPGGPIEAAAQKTAAATAEAAAAHTAMANPLGMAGGGVEVKIPGAKLPTGGDGPSFAGNYVNAVKILDTMQNQGAGDTLATKPAETLMPGSVGGIRATEDPESHELNIPGGAIRRAKHAMRAALKHLEKLGRKTRRAKKGGRKRTEKKRARK